MNPETRWKRDYSFLGKIEDKDLIREAWRELGRTDLYFLCKYILGFNKLETKAPIHHSLCYLLEQPFHRQLVLMFRGSFKTTIGMGKVIQWILQDPEGAQIGLGSDKIIRSEERVKVIRDILEGNEFLQQLYPEIFYTDPSHESDLWTKSEFNVKRQKFVEGLGFRKPTLSAFGLDPLPTGSHFSHVLLDDVENEANCNNDELIEPLVARVGGLIPALITGAPILMLGTIYHPAGPNTFYQSIWPTYKVAVVDTKGNPTFPSKDTRESIALDRRDTANEWLWQGQFMIKSIPRTDKFFFPFKGDNFQQCSLD